MDGYATHLPVLMTMLSKTTGPVIELGCGWYSTPLMHYVCKQTNRELWSLETDAAWINQFTKYNTGNHKVELISDWNNHDFLSKYWSLVFVDHAPALQRKVTMRQMMDNADFFVVHDTEADHVYQYSEVFKDFKYRFDYMEFRPWTSIVSNKYECNI
jgi:hypothetical protein